MGASPPACPRSRRVCGSPPEQEKNWPAYESALQSLTNYHRERMQAGHEQGRVTDPMQRLRQRAETLGSMGAALSRLADAQEPLTMTTVAAGVVGMTTTDLG